LLKDICPFVLVSLPPKRYDGAFFMAKDKTSFILYCDQQGLFNKLPDEIAGKLIKHIFAYVNDENPIASDLLLEIAFEPIKLQLKRDLRKYDDYIDKQRLNGAKGGRPSKPTETQITQPFFQEPKKADNVNVTANDTDNATNKKGFVKPTIEEVNNYMKEIEYKGDAEYFINHYQSNGWVVGRSKMKDWKSTVRNWKKNDKNFGKQTEQISNKPKLATL
jgi:hypothetical protein